MEEQLAQIERKVSALHAGLNLVYIVTLVSVALLLVILWRVW